MKISCPKCHQDLFYENAAPKFCQHCGFCLSSKEQTDQNVAVDSMSAMLTVPPTGTSQNMAVDATVAPQSRPEPVAAVPSGVGVSIGPYQTTDWLGAGGMGNVWQAVEIETGRRVALKRLSGGMSHDVDSIKRFNQEALLAAKISHPNVTFIYGTGQHEGAPYIAMELMPGDTVEDVVKSDGPMDVRSAIDKILNVIDGLVAIHAKGMVHRDIKPSNCFLAANGHIKVGDFGLSKSMTTENASLTKTGTFMGTPSYASPEQIRGSAVDTRTDMYSVGATLFFMLTGRTPYLGDSTSMMAQIIGDPVPSIRSINDQLPADLDLIIRKTMAKDADDRFGSLMELRAALLPYASHFDSVADAGRRFAAYMIDQSFLQIVGFALAFVVLVIAFMIYGEPPKTEDGSIKQIQLIIAVLMSVATFGYYTIGEGIFARSIGKWMMGLKLVNFENQSAGLWRSAVRTLFVPMGLGFAMFVMWRQYQTGIDSSSTNPAEFIMNLLFSLAITMGPIMLCMLTMRRSNRLLGLHGIVSGTRVVRAAQVVEKIIFPVADVRAKSVARMSFGPYSCDQLLGECEDGKVYLAKDNELQRDVWIVTRNSIRPVSETRMNLNRPSRQRWLEGGNCGDDADGVCRRWDAFESVHGMPIQQVVATGVLDQRGLHAKLMREFVRELIESIEDGSLPENVRLAQVWVNEEGNLKLVVNSLVDSVAVSNKDSRFCPISGETIHVQLTPVEQAVELIQQLGDVILRRRSIPISLRSFLETLDQKEATMETLNWADQELEELEKKTTVLSWDIRLGIMAMTIGTEAISFMIVSAGLILVSYYMTSMVWSSQLVLGGLLSLILPISLAAYFRGGLIFRIMGIQVCEKQGIPASPFKCAVRAALTWFPFVALISSITLVLIFTDTLAHNMETTEEGTVDFEITHNRMLMLSAILTMMVTFVISIVGALFAVASPKKGVIDYALGTELIPD